MEDASRKLQNILTHSRTFKKKLVDFGEVASRYEKNTKFVRGETLRPQQTRT